MRAFGPWCLAFMLSSLGAARAHAQSRGPALNWTRQPGAEACIGSVELAARVEERLKKKIFVAAPDAIVAVEGYVAPAADGFRASIALSDGQGLLYGSRELSAASDCRALDEGLVFVIAVSLRPEGGGSGIALPESVALELDTLFGQEPSEPNASTFAAQPSEEPPIERAAPPSTAPAPPEPERSEHDLAPLALEAIGIAHSGLQPIGTFGGGLGVRARLAGVGSVGLSGSLGVMTAAHVSDGSLRSRAELTNQLLTLGYCTPALWDGGALEAAPCALVRVGATRASGETFRATNAAGTSWLLSFGLAARTAWALSARVGLALSLGVELHAVRPAFAYVSRGGAVEELYTASLVGASAELSVVFALF